MAANDAGEYEEFARRAMPTLTRAFITTRGQDAPEAAAEALAYAWEHWDRVCELRNPLGFLYRVGQSRTRRRRTPMLPAPEAVGLPDVEPRLVPELQRLPETQRTAVWLVYACEWGRCRSRDDDLDGRQPREPRADATQTGTGGGPCVTSRSSCGSTAPHSNGS
jgi:hypothetical protein